MFYLITEPSDSHNEVKIANVVLDQAYTDDLVYYEFKKLQKNAAKPLCKEILLCNSMSETEPLRGSTALDDTEAEFFANHEKIPNQNHRIIVAGRSGSGKSTVIGKMLDQMSQDNPKPIIIISAIKSDPELDRSHATIEPYRLDLTHDSVFNADVEFFTDSIVVYDDVERITEKKLLKHILGLRDMMLEAGRHFNIDVISVTHDILGGSINKLVKAEATGCYLFPSFIQAWQATTFLKKYCGLSNKQIDEILHLPTRAVYIHMNSPMYYVAEKQVKLLV